MAPLTFQQLASMGLVQKQAAAAADWMHDHAVREFERTLGRRGHESPLETIFEFWWTVMVTARWILPDLILVPQKEVVVGHKKYRLDFAIEMDDWEGRSFKDAQWPLVCVELDGHDFHERTKEQVAHRNERDRALQSAGWLVLHYSGSELVKDPVYCIHDCNEKADSAFWKVKDALIDQSAAEYQAAQSAATQG